MLEIEGDELMINLLNCPNYLGRNTCGIKNICDGNCSWMEHEVEVSKRKAGETVTIQTKELEQVLFRLFNVLTALEDCEEENDFSSLKELQKQLGYQVTSKDLLIFARENGLDIT